MPNNTSFWEFKQSCENVLSYNWEDELEDFTNQMVSEEAVGGHIFWDMFVLSNVLRILGGEDPEEFGDLFGEGNPLTGASFYRCKNPKCEAICTRPDVFLGELPVLDANDSIPVGMCPVCGDYVTRV